MKINYFHYYYREKGKTTVRYTIDLTDLLKNEAFTPNGKIPSYYSEDGELAILLPTDNAKVFMLVATRRQDVIKAINSAKHDSVDIIKRLNQGEEVAFASYVYIDARWMGFASSQRGPRIGTFTSYIEHLLEYYGMNVNDHKFFIQPFDGSISEDAAKKFSFIGATSMKLYNDDTVANAIRGILNLPHSESCGVEIIIRPPQKTSIDEDFPNLLSSLNKGGVKSLKVMAKAGLDDALTEFFLTENGKLHDIIDKGTEYQMTNRLAAKAKANSNIKIQLTELEKNCTYSKSSLSRFCPDWDDPS